MITVYDTIRTLVRTEKALAMESEDKYVFEVMPKATKISIHQAIEEIYKVKVKSVNTQWVRGKLKRVRQEQGPTTAWKKAVVTLQEGSKIEVT